VFRVGQPNGFGAGQRRRLEVVSLDWSESFLPSSCCTRQFQIGLTCTARYTCLARTQRFLCDQPRQTSALFSSADEIAVLAIGDAVHRATGLTVVEARS